MSKQRSEQALPMVAAAATTAEPTQPAAEKLPVWRVSLKCPTPLRHRSADIEAANETAAWEAFMKMNGIGASDHERTITKV